MIDYIQINVLLFNAICSIGAFYISYLFMLKIWRSRGGGIDLSSFIGICIFFLLAGVTYLGWFYYFYFDFEFNLESEFFYKFGSISGYIGVLGLVFFTEKMSGKTKFSFTIFSIIVVIIGIVFPFSTDEMAIFSMITVLIMLCGFLFNFIIAIVSKTKGEIRRKMIRSLILSLGTLFFYVLNTDFLRNSFPIRMEYVSIIAMIGVIFTVIGLAKGFLSFETFTEFGWSTKMRELFIIAPNGVTLLYHPFVQRSGVHSSDLVTAGLTGVKDILAEMIQSEKKLQVIDHQDVKILFEYGIHSTIALVVYENLKIYRSKLTLLSTQFEQLFQDVLFHWTGNIEVFLPAKQLVDNIFG